MHTEAIETRVIGLAMIRLDAQLDNLKGPPNVHILHGKVLQGATIVPILVLTEQHRILILLMVETLQETKIYIKISIVQNHLRKTHPNCEVARRRVDASRRRQALGDVLQRKARHIDHGVELQHCV